MILHASILAAEKAKGGMDLLFPDEAEMIWGAAAFIVFFVVIAKLAMPGLRRVLRERTAKIQGQIEAAEHTRAEADGVLERYRAQLADAQTEGNRVIEEARRTAEAMAADIRRRADADAQTQLVRAQEDIRIERDRAISELRRELGELSIVLAGRIVQKNLDSESQRALVDRYIEELASLS
ncbi:MAG: F0F1 ATP synthase subunit B [Actinomycetota bacterium]